MEQREMKNWLHRYDRPGRPSRKAETAANNALSDLWQKRREREEAAQSEHRQTVPELEVAKS